MNEEAFEAGLEEGLNRAIQFIEYCVQNRDTNFKYPPEIYNFMFIQDLKAYVRRKQII